MAKVERIVNEVLPKFRTKQVTLTLNAEEAFYLLSVMNCVGGDPRTSPRKYNNSISDPLRELLGWGVSSVSKFLTGGSIHWKNDSLDEWLREAAMSDTKN